MKHFGDITKLEGYTLPPVDIVTGGSPCQDLSVAGKREGLAGERSGLFMEQIRVIKEMRENDRRNGRTGDLVRPRYMVWENVPGAFSSNRGEDFRAVLEETARVADETAVVPGPPNGKWPPAGCIVADGWSLAWRVHDAKDWGVPQRRKRVCLLSDFNGDSAGRILFELRGKTIDGETDKTVANSSGESKSEVQSVSNGLPRNPAESGAERKAVAPNSEERSGESVVSIDEKMGQTYVHENLGNTLGARDYKQPQAVAYTLKIRGGVDVDSHGKKEGKGALVQTELSGTLGVSQDQTLIQASSNPVLSFDPSFSSHYSGTYFFDVAKTITPGNAPGFHDAVAYGLDAYNQAGDAELAQPLRSADGGDTTPKVVAYGVVSKGNGDAFISEERHTSLSTGGGEAGQGYPCVVYGISAYDSNAMKSSNPHSGIYEAETARTLDLNGGSPACNQGGILVVSKELERKSYQDVTGALCASGYDKQGVQEAANDMYIVQPVVAAVDCRNGVEDSAVNASLQSSAGHNINSNNVCRQGSVVRRLTPLECERLQNFPDNWTNIGDWVDSKGKPHKGEADSPRYKALGNSIALPFWQWMADRMLKYIDHPATMASLFDGIGGFPLVFSRCGCTPVWASEIEEFPIAVTKIHFPEKE